MERNRLKRQLRELLRLEVLPMLHAFSPPLDVVIRAAPAAYTHSFADLKAELVSAIHRLLRLYFPDNVA